MKRHDAIISHIINQYPGCNDIHLLAMLRSRVQWLGKGARWGVLFAPSLATVERSIRRLSIAGKVVERQESMTRYRKGPSIRRFYPNNELWRAPKGYTIAPDGKSITCRTCGMTSYHPLDIANRFCGRCNRFHEDGTSG